MPAYLQKDLHYSSVHDGSLRQEDDNTAWGKEYVTSVLQGDLGLKNLKMICYELSKRCMVNKQCGVHVHLSGVNFNKENIVMMYWLYQRLQDEVYKMLPKSRRNNEYCRKLKPIPINIENLNSINRNFYIEKYYNEIILFVSKNNFPGREVNKKRDHPAGFKCGYDHSSSRYSWVNFVPSVFDTRGNKVYTIEFRPAPGSTSYLKIKNWLLICMALVDVVENHKQFLHKNRETVDLLSVLTEVYGQKANTLCKWVDERKQLFNVIPTNNDLANLKWTNRSEQMRNKSRSGCISIHKGFRKNGEPFINYRGSYTIPDETGKMKVVRKSSCIDIKIVEDWLNDIKEQYP